MDKGMILIGIVAIVAMVVVTAIVYGRQVQASGKMNSDGVQGTITTSPTSQSKRKSSN